MLSKQYRETIIKVLDNEGLEQMLTLISNIISKEVNDAWIEGYTDGYHDACENNM